MKLYSIFKKKVLIVICIPIPWLFTSCDQVFQANFNADIIDLEPSSSPEGAPADDVIVFSPGSIKVLAASRFASNSLLFERHTRGDQPQVEFITGAKPHSTSAYTITYKAYSEYQAAAPTLTMSVESVAGALAFQLELRGGKFHLISGNGDEVIGAYTANKIHNVIVVLDMLKKQFGLVITQTGERAITIEDKPFIEVAFSDLDKMVFNYPPAILEALPGKYIVDDIIISKKKQGKN